MDPSCSTKRGAAATHTYARREFASVRAWRRPFGVRLSKTARRYIDAGKPRAAATAFILGLKRNTCVCCFFVLHCMALLRLLKWSCHAEIHMIFLKLSTAIITYAAGLPPTRKQQGAAGSSANGVPPYDLPGTSYFHDGFLKTLGHVVYVSLYCCMVLLSLFAWPCRAETQISNEALVFIN